jgi:hypothetical protein
MGIIDRLLKTENKIRRRIENLFGDNAVATPLEVRREIIEQAEARILIDKGGKVFPFARILVRLMPRDQALHDVFEAAFLRDRSLQEDILEMLRESGARFPPRLDVAVELAAADDSPGEAAPFFALEFLRAEDLAAPGRPAALLSVVKGVAEQSSYPVDKDRVLIGRLAELTDREGQMARRNDIVFLDSGDEVNSTIGRAHASVFFDRERNEYRIVDEVSRFGTRIFREGRTVEVPCGNPRGIRLRHGDEIYIGRACLRFEIAGE